MTLPFMTAPSYSEWCLFWATGFALGFQLYQKMPPWFRRAWKTLMLISLIPVAIAAMLGVGHGCSAGARFPRMAETHMVDTSSKWRPLPQLVYIQPDAKEVKPTLALPPVPKIIPPTITNITSAATWTSTSATNTVTSGTMVVASGTTVVCGGAGACFMQSVAQPGGQVSVSVRSIPDSRMASMKSYPASQQPSRCMASCLSHHTSWVTPVEDSYCEKDTSNADGGFYGWVKEGDAWLPNVWPPTNQSTDRAPELIRLKEGEGVSLTEGKRSY